MAVDTASPEISAALGLLEAQVEAERRDQGAVGLSAAVVLDQDVIWARGFGYADVARAVPATPQTLYSIASITKLFTVTMLMQLRDAGKVGLDEPVARYVPAFGPPARFSNPGPITFRHLASHTAGLDKDFPFSYWETLEVPPIEALVASLPRAERVFPTLTAFKYSNIGMATLGYACQLIAGQPYTDYVMEHIVRPLGMAGSGFVLTSEMRARMAVGYWRTRAGTTPEVAPFFRDHDLGGLAATGGLYASVEHIARFMALQFRDGPAGGSQILTGATLREMHAPVFLRDGWQRAVGLGWWLGRVHDDTYIGHGGDHPGFNCDIKLVPELRLGVAIFVNTNTDPGRMTHAALELLAPIIRRASGRQEASAAGPDPAELRRYTGHYAGRMSVLDISLDGERLAVAFAISPHASPDRFTLEPIGNHVFRLQGGSLNGERMVFEPDGSGEVMRVRLNGYLAERAEDGR